jgi:hypothetical protein
MNEVSPKIIESIQTLLQIAAELRQGKDFKSSRLTPLKSLCSDPETAAKFALHIAQLTQKKMKERDRPSHITPEDWEQCRRLAADAVRGMTKYLRKRTAEAESPLRDLLHVIRNAQAEFERQHRGPARRIHSRDLLTVEKALECVLWPSDSQSLAYDLARHYSKCHKSGYVNELTPESAAMVEDIAEFWGRHFLGRGWRRRLAK